MSLLPQSLKPPHQLRLKLLLMRQQRPHLMLQPQSPENPLVVRTPLPPKRLPPRRLHKQPLHKLLPKPQQTQQQLPLHKRQQTQRPPPQRQPRPQPQSPPPP